MSLFHVPFWSNPILLQFHTWVILGLIWLILEGIIIFQKRLIVFIIITWFFELFAYFLGFFVLWHDCDYHSSIYFFFVLDITIYVIHLVEHELSNPGITLLFPLVSSARNFYCTCLRFSFLYLCLFLFSLYTLNESVGITLCWLGLNSVTNFSFTYVVYHFLYFFCRACCISWESMYTI